MLSTQIPRPALYVQVTARPPSNTLRLSRRPEASSTNVFVSVKGVGIAGTTVGEDWKGWVPSTSILTYVVPPSGPTPMAEIDMEEFKTTGPLLPVETNSIVWAAAASAAKNFNSLAR